MFKAQKVKTILLYFVFIYFVSMMAVMGNGHSFLGRNFSGYFRPVANSIGLNTTWNFFSPDPANALLLRYEVIFEDDYGKKTAETIEDYFPAGSEQPVADFRLDEKRLFYAMRWLALGSDRIQQFFVPMLCRKHPGAKKIHVQLTVKPIPPLEKVMGLPNEDFDSLTQDEQISENSYDCVS